MRIFCVTKCEQHSWRFLFAMDRAAARLRATFVLVADGDEAKQRAERGLVGGMTATVIRQVNSRGYIESVLDEAVSLASHGNFNGHLLRLDDDEKLSKNALDWLISGGYKSADHWQFQRVHFWHDETTVVVNDRLFPDFQTRLSSVQKSGGRLDELHAGSPFGPGETAPWPIEHHKFLVKDIATRRGIRWHRGGMLGLSVPEDAFTDMPVRKYLNGVIYGPTTIVNPGVAR